MLDRKINHQWTDSSDGIRDSNNTCTIQFFNVSSYTFASGLSGGKITNDKCACKKRSLMRAS